MYQLVRYEIISLKNNKIKHLLKVTKDLKGTKVQIEQPWMQELTVITLQHYKQEIIVVSMKFMDNQRIQK